jgi:hypothetical protein
MIERIPAAVRLPCDFVKVRSDCFAGISELPEPEQLRMMPVPFREAMQYCLSKQRFAP